MCRKMIGDDYLLKNYYTGTDMCVFLHTRSLLVLFQHVFARVFLERRFRLTRRDMLSESPYSIDSHWDLSRCCMQLKCHRGCQQAQYIVVTSVWCSFFCFRFRFIIDNWIAGMIRATVELELLSCAANYLGRSKAAEEVILVEKSTYF